MPNKILIVDDEPSISICSSRSWQITTTYLKEPATASKRWKGRRLQARCDIARLYDAEDERTGSGEAAETERRATKDSRYSATAKATQEDKIAVSMPCGKRLCNQAIRLLLSSCAGAGDAADQAVARYAG